MLALVVDRMQGDVGALATMAAAVIGGTAYDVRACMMVPGGGPAVLTVVATVERATELRAALEKQGREGQATPYRDVAAKPGFRVTVVPVKAPRPFFDVRQFALTADAFEASDRSGQTVSIPYAAINCLVRGSHVTTTSTSKIVRERKFSPGRSILSGGLVNTRVQKTKKTIRSTGTDERLAIYAGDAMPLRLSEQALQYQGLGKALQPSRIANFMYLAKQLRELAPGAVFDERLRRRAAQSQILGRTLSADDHFDFAVWLVAASVRQSRNG